VVTRFRLFRSGPSLPINLFSNYVGTIWAALIQVLAIPVYIRILGIESYGVIGFFLTLQAVVQVFDLGLSPTVNREMARSSRAGTPGAEARDLLRTVEYVYWGVGAVIGSVIAASSPLLVTHWMHLEALERTAAVRAVFLMGIVFAIQWPTSCYAGALMGLNRQLLVNSIKVVTTTFTAVGAIAVLSVTPTITAFFLWRAIAALLEVLTTRWALWRLLTSPNESPALFRVEILSRIRKFSGGMALIAASVVILMQVDKIVLSAVLSMEHFGFYMAAVSAANFLPQLGGPVFSAVFPSLSQLVASGDVGLQKRQFHLGAQVMAVVVFPPAVAFVLFAQTVIQLWTKDSRLAVYSGPVLTLLAAGALLNSIMVLPYAMQLAHGWTKLTVVLNSVLVCVMVPYTVVAVRQFGIVGAASTWGVLNLISLVVAAPLTFARLLPGEGRRWIYRDVATPALAVFAASGLIWLIMPEQGTRLLMASKVALALTCSAVSALLAAADVRFWVGEKIASVRLRPVAGRL